MSQWLSQDAFALSTFILKVVYLESAMTVMQLLHQYPNSCIRNMDETPLCLDVPRARGTTVTKAGGHFFILLDTTRLESLWY